MNINRVLYKNVILDKEHGDKLFSELDLHKIKPSKLPKFFKVEGKQSPSVSIVYRAKLKDGGYVYLWSLSKHGEFWIYSEPKKCNIS